MINENENILTPINECEKLAIDGEQALKTNDTIKGNKYKLNKNGTQNLGIQMLEKALLLGTDDQYLLSSIYSQLGL